MKRILLGLLLAGIASVPVISFAQEINDNIPDIKDATKAIPIEEKLPRNDSTKAKPEKEIKDKFKLKDGEFQKMRLVKAKQAEKELDLPRMLWVNEEREIYVVEIKLPNYSNGKFKVKDKVDLYVLIDAETGDRIGSQVVYDGKKAEKLVPIGNDK